MLNADPDWWKQLFDHVYLMTDSRSVGDEDLTRKEVDMIERVLGLDRSAAILDLCGGQGRHACELYRRGFANVTVVDYSEFLLEKGRELARTEGINVTFVRADARHTELPASRFDAAVVMANSFGYFSDPSDDRRFLAEVHRLLSSGGKVLLDLLDAQYVVQRLQPLAWHEVQGDIVVCRARELNEDLITSREMVISKTSGLIRDQTYCVRLYSPERISELLSGVGFSSVERVSPFTAHDRPGDYGFLTNRMVVTARKGG